MAGRVSRPPARSVVRSVCRASTAARLLADKSCVQETRRESSRDQVTGRKTPRRELVSLLGVSLGTDRAQHSCRACRLDRCASAAQNEVVSRREIDDYLAKLDEPKLGTLRALRQTILGFIPEAEQRISYGVPAFNLQGKAIAGFAAFKNHLSYLPHSGSVLGELHDDVAKYVTSKGALQFPIDTPLPEDLVEKLIAVRIRQAFQQ